MPGMHRTTIVRFDQIWILKIPFLFFFSHRNPQASVITKIIHSSFPALSLYTLFDKGSLKRGFIWPEGPPHRFEEIWADLGLGTYRVNYEIFNKKWVKYAINDKPTICM